MKHHNITDLSEIHIGDKVLYKSQWRDVISIHHDNGILLSDIGWICGSELLKDENTTGSLSFVI